MSTSTTTTGRVSKPSQAGFPRCMQCGKERYARADSHFCTHKCAVAWADDHMVPLNPAWTTKTAAEEIEQSAMVSQYGWCHRCMTWDTSDHKHALVAWPNADTQARFNAAYTAWVASLPKGNRPAPVPAAELVRPAVGAVITEALAKHEPVLTVIKQEDLTDFQKAALGTATKSSKKSR